MKKLVVLTLMLLATFSASAKKDWKGKVVDQNGEPVAYANVAMLGYKTVYLSPVDGMIITLARTPGLVKGQNGLEVIGKGAPLVYINGRKVTDASELQRRHGPESPNVTKHL